MSGLSSLERRAPYGTSPSYGQPSAGHSLLFVRMLTMSSSLLPWNTFLSFAVHAGDQQDPLPGPRSLRNHDGDVPVLTGPHLDALEHEAMRLPGLEIIDIDLRDDRNTLDLVACEGRCGIGRKGPLRSLPASLPASNLWADSLPCLALEVEKANASLARIHRPGSRLDEWVAQQALSNLSAGLESRPLKGGPTECVLESRQWQPF